MSGPNVVKDCFPVMDFFLFSNKYNINCDFSSHISDSISWIYFILGLMICINTVSCFILVVGQCDLYFMVQ